MFMNIYICVRRLLLSRNYCNSVNFPLCHSHTKGQEAGWGGKGRAIGHGPLCGWSLIPEGHKTTLVGETEGKGCG